MKLKWTRPIRWGVALAALGVFAAATGANAAESWQQTWDKTLAAAEKEGVVVVSGPPGADQRRVITQEWAKTYPKIKLEYTGGRGSQMVAKVVRERTAGIYNWDVILASTDPTVFTLTPIHALAPLRDALIRPDLTEDKTWFGGFKAGFLDDAGTTFYSPIGNSAPLGFANRDCISKAVFNKLDDLKKPELKGKIAWHDITRPGASTQGLGVLELIRGEAWLKDMFTKHDVVFSRDYRQLADWLVSCKKPVVMGVPDDVLMQMQAHGLGKNVEYLLGPAWTDKMDAGGAGGNESIGWYNNAPHPNAAKIFVNFYMSRAFQQAYADETRSNSRRLDTTPGDPRLVMKPGVEYFNFLQSRLARVKKLQAHIRTWGIMK